MSAWVRDGSQAIARKLPWVSMRRGAAAIGVLAVVTASQTVGAQPDVFVRAHLIGQGVLRPRDNQCFVITPRHVIDSLAGEIDLVLENARSGTAEVTKVYEADLALLTVTSPQRQRCDEWPSESDVARAIAGAANGVLRIREEDGSRTLTPVSIQNIDVPFLTVRPTHAADVLRQGMSGAQLLIGNVLVGLLFEVKEGRGRVFRIDEANKVIGSFFQGAPAEMSYLSGVSTVMAGSGLSCGITRAEGTIYCWGKRASKLGGNQGVATRLSGWPPLTALTLGEDHACGLSSAGTAYCWGSNDHGQLGDGSTVSSLSPVTVSGGVILTTIDAGGDHTCAISTSNQLYCWGANQLGQLGDGTSIDRSRPQLIASTERFGAVGAGLYHSCAVRLQGSVMCWGYNVNGALGDGTTVPSNKPQEIAIGIGFASIVPGAFFTCGVSLAGPTYCWGNNAYGQLGNGLQENQRLIPTRVSADVEFASLTAGNYHTCGIAGNGTAYCWGFGEYGSLGSGTKPVAQVTPIAVSANLRFTSISAGVDHTCGVTTTAQSYCWGRNAEGQIGNGETVPVAVPARVAAPNP